MARLSVGERREILEKQGNKCFDCGGHLKSTLLGDADDFNRTHDWACVDNSRRVIVCRSCPKEE